MKVVAKRRLKLVKILKRLRDGVQSVLGGSEGEARDNGRLGLDAVQSIAVRAYKQDQEDLCGI